MAALQQVKMKAFAKWISRVENMITGKTLVNYIYFYKIKSGEKSFQKSNLLPLLSNIFKDVGYIIHSSGSCCIF